MAPRALRMLERLEHEDAAGLAHDEAVAPGVEGAARPLGSSFRRESARIAPKPAMPTRVMPASVPPQNITSARPSRIASAPSPMAMFDGGARRALRGERPARAELHGHPAGAHVRDDGRDRERVDPVGAAVEQRVVAVLEGLQPADPGRDRGADPLGLRRDVEPRVGLGLPGGGEDHVREAVHAPRRPCGRSSPSGRSPSARRRT